METLQPILCVFAKPPAAGRVKTRLAPALGSAGAAELAGALLQDTLSLLGGLGWGRTVVASTGAFGGSLSHLVDGYEVWDQGGGDLGARIERVLRRALEASPGAMALGADSPAMPCSGLEAARRAVERGEAAIGPSLDGGFWLLGLPRCPDGLLDDLPWSGEETFAATVHRLEEAGFVVREVEPTFDIDVPRDLDRLETEIRAGTLCADATALVLETIRRGQR